MTNITQDQLDNLQEQIDDLKRQIEQKKPWPQVGDHWFYVSGHDAVIAFTWRNTEADHFRRDFGLGIQPTREAMQEVLDAHKAIKALSFKPDWSDHEQEKWYVRCNHPKGKFLAQYTKASEIPKINYFPDEETAEKATPHYETLRKHGAF